MDCCTPGSSVLHYLSEFAQISYPLSQGCYLTISFSAAHFSFCLQSFPASGSFPVSWLFTSGGQSIRSFSFSLSPSNEYSGLISFIFCLLFFFLLFLFVCLFYFILFFYFTILYQFCHTLTWIRHGCTWVPNPEPPSHHPPHIIYWLVWFPCSPTDSQEFSSTTVQKH